MRKEYCTKAIEEAGENEKEKIRQIKEEIKKCRINAEFLNRRGIPEQYGIFYAMGLALLFEGVLSGCYHLCPVEHSFQFDTTFMYVMCGLIFLKIYQLRHPDTTANANSTFSIIVVMLIFEAFGYYDFGPDNAVYYVFFVLTYLVLIFTVFCEFYFVSNFKQSMKSIWKIEISTV